MSSVFTNQLPRLGLALLLCCMASPLAWGSPCDDVLERAEGAATSEEADRILGGCLAASGPPQTHLQVAHTLLQRTDDEGLALACRYTEIILRMLDYDMPELEASTRHRIREAADAQACHCDRQWSQAIRQQGGDPALGGVSWLGDDFQQSESFFLSDQQMGKDLELRVFYRQAMDHACIFVDHELRINESRGSVTSGFQRGEFFVHRNHGQDGLRAILLWRLGVHGEALQLLDLEQRLPVWEKRSDWPVEFTLGDDGLTYRYFRAGEGGDPEVIDGRY
ncbi:MULTISPECIES: hypothetical protein [unclassified Thioalkalivibrio]|uniref:hypothetical protein n=1 Tax=unclassified Thioalkalivibrio TaxID=2621013 RepID=UPI00037AE673|nr:MULTISPECIES: hypothetical protein [unclassified Thioalkalivibrio]